MRQAVPLVLQQDLSTTRRTVATIVSAQSDAYQIAAGAVLQTTVEIRDERLRIQGTLTDLSTQRALDVFVLNGSSRTGLVAALNELAGRIDQNSGSFSTKKESALSAYVQAVTSPNAESRIPDLEKAIGLDPGFGLGYLTLAQAQAQAGSPDLTDTIANANSRRARFIPLDQARLDSFNKRASHAPLAEQAKATQALADLAPNDVETLTLLGSQRFLLADAAAGERLLRRALSLNPENLSVRQQLALGFLQSRQFDAVEKTLAGLENTPALFPELAVCALLKGDSARANTIYSRYVGVLQSSNDPAAMLSQANGIAITQTPAKAAEFLKQSKFPTTDLQSLALSQAAIWSLMAGDFPGAKASAAAALGYARAPIAKAFAIAAVLDSKSDSPVEQFRAQVNAAPIDAGAKNLILAYGLFFQKHYAESAEIWKSIVKESGDSDLRNRAMLAGALDQSGRPGEAEALHVQPFVPNLTGGDEFAVAAFQEMRRLLKLTL